MRRILAATAAAGVLVAGGTVAAVVAGGEVGASEQEGAGVRHLRRGPHPGEILYRVLLGLEDRGALDEGQAEAVEDYVRGAVADRIRGGEGFPEDRAAFMETTLRGAVDEGIIDDRQAAAIADALRSAAAHIGERGRMIHRAELVLDEALDRLVDDGTLTTDQVDAIRAEIGKVIEEHLAGRTDGSGGAPSADDAADAA